MLQKIINHTPQKTTTIDQRDILDKLDIITRKVNSSLELEEVLDVTIAELRKLFYFEGFAVLLLDEKKEFLITVKLVIPDLDQEKVKQLAARNIPLNIEVGGSLAYAVLNKKDLYFENVVPEKLPDGVNKKAVIDTGGIKSILIMPLTINDDVVGAILMSAYRKNLDYSKNDIATIRLFVEHLSGAIKNSFLNRDLKKALAALEKANLILKKQKKQLESLSITDSLTGIRNRRYFDERIALEFEKSKRYNKTIFIMMLDIDNFKSVNDDYGHDCGDYILIKIAKILRSSLRVSDFLARYGGEEFIIALFETDLPGVKMVAKKVIKSLAEATYKYENHEIKSSVSIGFSRYPSPAGRVADSIETVIKEADEALYLAKKTGKNKWVYYHEPANGGKKSSSRNKSKSNKIVRNK